MPRTLIVEKKNHFNSKPQEKYLTIQEIIKKLKNIVEETRVENPNLAYFAILYLYVTIQVSKEIDKETFENNTRMKRLDVIFALRYIDAYEKWQKNEKISESWKVAFDFGKKKNSMIMQHLLLGMNAHINYDLGIATVEATSLEDDYSKSTRAYENFNSIIKDFTTINEVLKKLTKTVESSLAHNSYFFKLILKYGKNKEDALANFSVELARTGAWYFASTYRKYYDSTLPKDIEEKEKILMERDEKIRDLGKNIAEPDSKLINLFLTIGAITEVRSTKNFIETLIIELDDFVDVEYHAI